MNTRILLIGSNGQIGFELRNLLPRIGEVLAVDRQQLDLSDTHSLRRLIRDTAANVIVNAAAYTAVDEAESHEAVAHAVNAVAPAIMAEEAKGLGVPVIHYSTDYVFDGLKSTPYEENDPTNPLSVYGKTKLAGEFAIRESRVPHLIFRTGWVYATRRGNFLLTVLRLASERDELSIVCDQIGAPTWCHEVAQATTTIIGSLQADADTRESWSKFSGTYHMTAAGKTSWYGFARAILVESKTAPADLSWMAQATGGKRPKARWILPITTDQYRTPAHRPAYSVLSNSLLTRTFGLELPHWRDQLNRAFRK